MRRTDSVTSTAFNVVGARGSFESTTTRQHGDSVRRGASARTSRGNTRCGDGSRGSTAYRRATRGWNKRGNYEGDTHDVSLLLLRQEPGSGATAHRGTRWSLHLRRVRRPVPRDHRGRTNLGQA